MALSSIGVGAARPTPPGARLLEPLTRGALRAARAGARYALPPRAAPFAPRRYADPRAGRTASEAAARRRALMLRMGATTLGDEV
jgi:hypothetical protein